MRRPLAVLIGALLIGATLQMIYGITVPVPKSRTGGPHDFIVFASSLLAVYGGILAGALVYWVIQKRAGQASTAFGIFMAGAGSSLMLSVAFVVCRGLYGLITSHSFEQGVGNLWGLIVIFWFLLGTVAAAGIALLLYGLQGPTGRAGASPQAGGSSGGSE
jgi:hypothetical protein